MSTKAQHVHPILSRTPGMPARFERLRFMTADAGAAGTPGAPAGGTGDGATAGDQGANSGQGDQTATAAGNGAQNGRSAASAAATTADAAGPGGDNLPDDPAVLKGMIADLRRENGSARTNAKAQAADEARTALVQELGKALGLVKDGEQAPKPEELTAQVQAAQHAARAAQVELAVHRAASTHRADPSALLDSRAFLAKVVDLDPTANDFGEKVTAAIKQAVTDNPKLLAAQAAGASSVDHAGGSGEARTRTPKPLADAVAGHYGTA
ncbi:hypothetical protein [Cellulosimicrobium sp. JZ28]|uniref:hypothetical protein n=1 Tax=Cellulosimicrobium sp. JZ28 TaxID=1906273 RepID=UPI00188CE654|nr:hypothetical protein [Cellulosimicrobium sp. JZ28]